MQVRSSQPQQRKPSALTVAGSDCSGGAGVQADLRSFAGVGVHGASVVTCVTAQTPSEVTAIQSAKASVVEAQLEAVFASLPVSAVKTGMLFSRPIIDAVAKRLAKRRGLQLVSTR